MNLEGIILTIGQNCYTLLCKIDILMITSMTDWAGNLIYCAFNRSDSRANITVACKTQVLNPK